MTRRSKFHCESLESRTLLTTFTPVDGPALSNVLNGATLVGGKPLQLGDSTSAQSTLDVVPNHINFDRSYFHPYWNQQTIRRAIALHDDYTDITNCYIEEIHEGSDSNAIIGWNGVGHYNILNNHLEGAGENILFGGATNRLPTVISDVLIQGNHIIKPVSWRGTWTAKNLIEFKQGSHITVQGNILE